MKEILNHASMKTHDFEYNINYFNVNSEKSVIFFEIYSDLILLSHQVNEMSTMLNMK